MSDNFIDAALLEPVGDLPERLRFRLQHLFALTAVMAVMLAIGGSPQEYFGQPNTAEYRHLTTTWSIVTAIFNSVAITLTGYGLYWRKRGRAFLVQPGHWLLVVTSIAAAATALQTIGFRIANRTGLFDMDFMKNAPPGTPPIPSDTMLLFFAGIFAVSLMFVALHLTVNIIVGRKQAERRWQWVFFIKAIALFTWMPGTLLIMVWMIRTIWLDRREGVPHDAVHWCGVVLELCHAFVARSPKADPDVMRV